MLVAAGDDNDDDDADINCVASSGGSHVHDKNQQLYL